MDKEAPRLDLYTSLADSHGTITELIYQVKHAQNKTMYSLPGNGGVSLGRPSPPLLGYHGLSGDGGENYSPAAGPCLLSSLLASVLQRP